MDDSTRPGQHGKVAAREQRLRRARQTSTSDSSMTLAPAGHKKDNPQEGLAQIREALAAQSVVLIGLMGVGKTAVGKRLAARLDLPFVDADTEIETAAGMTVSEIFARHG